jgi:type IVB pilus formation R64 PilN family outer membrane protein
MKLKFFLILIFLSVLSACSSFDVASSKSRKDIQNTASDTINVAKSHKPEFTSMSRITNVKGFYVPELMEREKEKPSWFFKPIRGNYKQMTLSKFMLQLQTLHGVNARYLDGLDLNKTFSMVHDGSVGEALSKVELATAFGYEVEGDVITWSKYVTEYIDISTIPGVESFQLGSKAKKSGAPQKLGDTVISDTGISEDGSFSMLELKGNDVLQNIFDVATMLKSEEGRLALDKSTTSLVVRDFPENVRRIKDYITTQNARITAQAVFDIMIIDYIKTSGDEVTFNIDLIRNDLASAGIQSLTTGFASSLIGSITPTVLTYTRKEGKYAGASAILEALKSRGAVLNVINPSLIVTNNRISKIVDSSDRAYLASSGTSQTANVGQTAILTPGIVKTGLKLWALADINLKDDSIMAKVANSFSDLVEISTATSGGSTIQTPSTSTNEFDQTFFIHDGETILLGGLGTNRQEVTENTGGALGIGGEKGVKYVETETLILITPRIIRK